MTSIAQEFLTATTAEFQRYRDLAEKSFAQLDDPDFFLQPDPESNSIAMIVQHLGGNLKSRWTDFLTTDGEKPTRERDAEFEVQTRTRAELLAVWNEGFTCLFGTLRQLKPEDLLKTVTIRGQPHTVIRALQRALTHVGYHVGQIVYLAKSIKREGFKSLSIPRGQSKGSRAY